MNHSHTKKIVTLSLLIAMDIILTRIFPIQATPAIRIAFGFVPIAIMAMLYGPILAGVAAAVADFVGIMLFPPAVGSFFPGFTLTAYLTGIIYGMFFRKQRIKFLYVITPALLVTVGLNLLLDTFWLSIIIPGRGYFALLPERLIRTAIMLPLQIICLRFVTSERFRALLR